MKIKRFVSIVLAATLMLVTFGGCGNKTDNAETTNTTTTANPSNQVKKTIAVISGGNGGFWDAVKKGAEDAANEYGYELSFRGYDTKADEDAQEMHIKNAVSENVNAIAFAPVGDGYDEELAMVYDKKIPLVQFDTKISPSDGEILQTEGKYAITSTVVSADKDAGALAAEKLYDAVKEEIKNSDETYIIGVILHDKSSSAVDRDKGFTEKFAELADADEATKGKYGIKKELEDDYTASLDNLYKNGAKAVFMTNENIGNEICDYVSKNSDKFSKITFCGFDSGTKQIQWLKSEKGAKFIGAVARNAYDLGYNAVEQCVFAIEGKEVKETVEIGVEWYNTSNVDKLLQDGLVYNG